jgi:hypothetical protein
VAVTPHEFLRESGALFGCLGLVSAALSYGFWRCRTWVRPLLLLPVLGVASCGIREVLRTSGLGKGSLLTVTDMFFAAGVYWYLYLKSNVAAYFAQSADRDLTRAGARRAR